MSQVQVYVRKCKIGWMASHSTSYGEAWRLTRAGACKVARRREERKRAQEAAYEEC